MPKVKKGTDYKKTYTEQNVQDAVDAVRRGLPKTKAAWQYQVPRSTLQFRLSDKFIKTSPGPPPVLGYSAEKELVNWVKECSEKGFPRRKEDLQASVKEYLDENRMKTPFKNNMPGDGWYKSFLKRNPSLAERFPEGVTSASSCVSESDIRKWFKEIHDYLSKMNHLDILEDPSRIFNSDETYFMVCPKMKHVLAPKGSQNVYEVEKGNAKLNLTVLFTFNANGVTTPPTFVYPYKRLPTVVGQSVPSEWGIGVTPTGWMNSDLFIEYLNNIFCPYLKEEKIKFPVILFVDGHKSHVTLQVSKVCSELQIILICLYPNSTRMLQPADVAAFKPIKSYWKQSVLSWRQKNPTENITLDKMAPILKIALEKFNLNNKSFAVQNGFKACGLYPWDPDAVDYSKCLATSKKKVVADVNTSIPNTATVSYQTFTQIIGVDKLNELLSSTENCFHEKSEEFHILYNLLEQYKKLSSNEQVLNPETASIENSSNKNELISEEKEILDQNVYNDLKEYYIENLEDVPIVLDDLLSHEPLAHSSLVLDSKNSFEINYEIIVSEQEIVNSLVLDNTNNFDKIEDNAKKSLLENNDDISSVIHDNTINVIEAKGILLNDSLDNNENETEEEKQNKFIDTDTNLFVHQFHEIEEAAFLSEENLNSLNDTEDKILDLSVTTHSSTKTISNFLQKPSSPKRKGKKFTEKTTYAISSKEWKLKEEEKINKQKMEIKRKEARRQEILEKKKVTEKMKIAKENMKIVKKENLQKSIKSIKKEKIDKENKNKEVNQNQRKTKPKILSDIILK